MGALEKLESCETIFLVGICEPSENQLQILLQEAKTHRDKPRRQLIAGVDLGVAYPIAPDKNSRFFQLEWAQYIGYQVLNESFSKWPEGEQFVGKNLRVFADSAYLRFLNGTSYASSEHPGPFQHYEIVSQQHVVDVAAENSPEITILTERGVSSGASHVCRVAFTREGL